MDNELIQNAARVLERAMAFDVECGALASELTHSERCNLIRAILPIARKHYAEVFAKVADGEMVDAVSTQDEGDFAYNRGCSDCAAAIRQAGEA